MITISNPERYVAGLYTRLSNENIENENGVLVKTMGEKESHQVGKLRILEIKLSEFNSQVV